MATLAAKAPRKFHETDFLDYPVLAADIIYEGAAVGENGSGYARPLVAGDVFLGFAENTADNSAGSAGDVDVSVRPRGYIELSISAIAITANDRPAVYASDDNTFTLTKSTNSLIGYVAAWVSTGVAIVEFDALAAQAALQA